MKNLNEKQIEQAFVNWNEAFVKDPTKFNESVKELSECKTYAERQTKTLFNHVKK